MSDYNWVDTGRVRYEVSPDTTYGVPAEGDSQLNGERLPCWKITRWAGNHGTTFARYASLHTANTVALFLNDTRHEEVN